MNLAQKLGERGRFAKVSDHFMGTKDLLENLNKEIRKCKRCNLAETRINK